MTEKTVKRPRVVVIVSPDPSDTYFANRMLEGLNVAGVVVEGQYPEGPGAAGRLKKAIRYSARPDLAIRRLKERAAMRGLAKRAEEATTKGFGEAGLKIREDAGCEVLYTKGVNDINAPENVEAIRSMAPEVITVCGSSILKRQLLSIAPLGVLNLHGGLSQWYRGVWTTLWAVYNGEPEYVGCTVHYVSEGIDDGKIVYQGRPVIEADDDHETLYVKVVKLGVELMTMAVEDIGNGIVRAHRLEKKGALYLKGRVTPEVIRQTWQRVDEGVIREYVKRGGARPPLKIHEPGAGAGGA